MTDSRRDFLKKAALLTGAAGIAGVIPESIQRAMAIKPPPGSTYMRAEKSKLKHPFDILTYSRRRKQAAYLLILKTASLKSWLTLISEAVISGLRQKLTICILPLAEEVPLSTGYI